MRVISKEEFMLNREYYFSQIRKGAIFIHPTDTIYGMGCDATNSEAVNKLRRLKERQSSPLSVIAPSKEWIMKNCDTAPFLEWLDKLPGAYTFIFRMLAKGVAYNVNPKEDSLGVRIPNHWISSVVNEMGIPIVTTSVNKSGQDFMREIEEIDSQLEEEISFAIYEGPMRSKPSTVVKLIEEPSVMRK